MTEVSNEAEVPAPDQTPEPVDSIDIEDFVRQPCACGHQLWRHGPLGRQCQGERYVMSGECDCPNFREPSSGVGGHPWLTREQGEL